MRICDLISDVCSSDLRPNSYTGLAIPFALYGEAGLAVAALIVAAVVPTVNLISVAALVRYGGNYAGRNPSLLRAVLLNPLILSCLAGLALNVSGLGLPPVADETPAILARAALPPHLLARSGERRVGKELVRPGIS